MGRASKEKMQAARAEAMQRLQTLVIELKWVCTAALAF